jgi:GntR family transcriptional regulator
VVKSSSLSRDSAEPLYLQIANRIAADISSGRLAPGAQVSSEAELMQMHGVSRITVRQALALLARNGQVVARSGKGTFVSRPAVHHDLDTLRGFQDALLRQGIEPRTELLEFSASGGRTDRSLPEGLNLPVRLRRLYRVDDQPFALVEAFLPAEAAGLGVTRARRLMVYDIVQQFLGLRIARADVVIRCAQPGPERARALGVPARTHVLLMERTSIATNGQPCEFMRIHIAPERYAFRLSLPGPLEIARALHPVPQGAPATPLHAPPSRRARSKRKSP